MERVLPSGTLATGVKAPRCASLHDGRTPRERGIVFAGL